MYRALGVNKQAVHQNLKRQKKRLKQILVWETLVQKAREKHPGCGLDKLYWTIQPEGIGRDRFIDLFQQMGYGVVAPRNRTRTTYSVACEYENLIEGMLVDNINQVLQSDITYFWLNGEFYYIIFLIDVYSKRVVGHQISPHLRASANVRALEQVIKLRGAKNLLATIHHSDHGSQYTSKEYTVVLKKLGCHISMGTKGQENAYAERINGTIKNEYLKYWTFNNFLMLKRKLNKAVYHYNHYRIHQHLPNKETPIQFENNLNADRLAVPHYEVIFTENGPSRKDWKASNIDIKTTDKHYFCPIFSQYII